MRKRAFITAILDRYVPKPEIPLHYKDPYTLLIAVLLSARCTDERVNQVTPHLFAKASTPETMMTLRPEEVESVIRPCGLAKTKARAIVKLSEMITRLYKGRVPRTMKALEKLPGVGHKTASVVLTQAFHKCAFPIDTHIQRSAQRWGITHETKIEKIEEDLKRFFPRRDWGKIHLQMILFARKYCPARGHNPKQCPMCRENTYALRNVRSNRRAETANRLQTLGRSVE